MAGFGQEQTPSGHARRPLYASRGRPVVQGFGKCGAITRHSASVRSVWYRVTVRLYCRRVVGVHMAKIQGWFEKPLGIMVGAMTRPLKSCRDIDAWLRGIGLAQYAERCSAPTTSTSSC